MPLVSTYLARNGRGPSAEARALASRSGNAAWKVSGDSVHNTGGWLSSGCNCSSDRFSKLLVDIII